MPIPAAVAGGAAALGKGAAIKGGLSSLMKYLMYALTAKWGYDAVSQTSGYSYSKNQWRN